MKDDMPPEASKLDELVNQLKAEYTNKPSAMSEDKAHANANEELLAEVKSQFQEKSASAATDDDLMDDIKSRYQKQSQDNTSDLSLPELKSQLQNLSPSHQNENEELLAQIKSGYQQQKQVASAQNNNSRTDQWLGSLKEQHQTGKTYEDERDLKRNREEILKAEQQKQKKRKHLTQKAQAWLENLDPYSDEGFWFEEFAESYHSRLEAAIEYIAVFEET
jgi:hypothetical protein